MAKKKLVCGIGINDADYNVYHYENHKAVWRCPFYVKWCSMLRRCYSASNIKKNPTYTGCTVCDDWVYFSKFKTWMEEQEWEGLELDKDILINGNKVYSPKTCVFVGKNINTFICDAGGSRGSFPIGVNFDTHMRKYKASCWCVSTKKQKTVGYFDTQEEAHKAWLAFKLEQAHILAAQQTDERVAKALIERYENFKLEGE